MDIRKITSVSSFQRNYMEPNIHGGWPSCDKFNLHWVNWFGLKPLKWRPVTVVYIAEVRSPHTPWPKIFTTSFSQLLTFYPGKCSVIDHTGSPLYFKEREISAVVSFITFPVGSEDISYLLTLPQCAWLGSDASGSLHKLLIFLELWSICPDRTGVTVSVLMIVFMVKEQFLSRQTRGHFSKS